MNIKNDIQPATNADRDQVKSLIYSVLLEYGLQPDPQGTDLDLEDIDKHYTNNGGYFGVLRKGKRANDEIVASVGIRRIDSTSCELRKMYMQLSLRGQGVGKQLLEFALVKARKLGYRRVVLETASPLVEAISLYKKYGFKEIFPEHLSQRCDQAYELVID